MILNMYYYIFLVILRINDNTKSYLNKIKNDNTKSYLKKIKKNNTKSYLKKKKKKLKSILYLMIIMTIVLLLVLFSYII